MGYLSIILETKMGLFKRLFKETSKGLSGLCDISKDYLRNYIKPTYGVSSRFLNLGDI